MDKNRYRRRKRRKTANGLRVLCIVLACVVLLSAFFLFLASNREVVITLNGEESVEAEYGKQYKDQGATAEWRSTYFTFMGGSVPVEVVEEVNTDELGENTVTYEAEYKGHHEKKHRRVKVVDSEAPVITLNKIEDYFTLPNTPYVEEGYTATDNVDGDVTDKVKCVEKDGKVYYEVTDSSGNTGKAERTIFYDDRMAPEIVFNSPDSVIQYGDWADSFVATDDVDGDVTALVKAEGTVDVNTPGEYVINYSVKDAHGNETVVQRVITVLQANRAVWDSVGPVDGEKIVFLTFDDGPGQYTEWLLSILAKYNVPATFFVTDQFGGYRYVIGEEAAQGHTVAVHTYSHVYSDIYNSAADYWNDFDAMNGIIEEQTGYRSDIFRFPGGSSNMVSASYCDGIMSELAAQADAMGLDYYDWNVSSGDAGGAYTSWDVYQNVISGIQSHDISVVLMHDIYDYTVGAVEDIIKWGLENGYTFMRLEKGITYCRHGINN